MTRSPRCPNPPNRTATARDDLAGAAALVLAAAVCVAALAPPGVAEAAPYLDAVARQTNPEDSGRGGMAVCERPTPHRPCRGFGVPSTRSRATTAFAERLLRVSGTDEQVRRSWWRPTPRGVPRETADRFNKVLREDFATSGCPTTCHAYHDEEPLRRTRDLFRTHRRLRARREALGAFSATTGHTLPDRYIEGTCPICGFQSARGDQCDNCGNQLDPTDLIDPRSTIDGAPPRFETTSHLFLDLPAFKTRLTEWIESKESWRPNVRRFSLNFVKELKPRPITRDLDWGVPIPVEGYDGRDDKRIYVCSTPSSGTCPRRSSGRPTVAHRMPARLVSEPVCGHPTSCARTHRLHT